MHRERPTELLRSLPVTMTLAATFRRREGKAHRDNRKIEVGTSVRIRSCRKTWESVRISDACVEVWKANRLTSTRYDNEKNRLPAAHGNTWPVRKRQGQEGLWSLLQAYQEYKVKFGLFPTLFQPCMTPGCMEYEV